MQVAGCAPFARAWTSAQRVGVEGAPTHWAAGVVVHLDAPSLDALRSFVEHARKFRGPGLIQVDMSLIRDFRITEKVHTEFRAEVFNVINRTNFGNPGTVFGSSTFGVISSAAPARQVQLGLRVTF